MDAESALQLQDTAPLTAERVLVADDDTASLLLLSGMLRRQGCDVTAVTDGARAVAACREGLPDLVLLDVSMPGMDGYDAARLIKQMAAGRYLPIIFITALTDEQALADCLDAGGDDFLVKPYSDAVLAAKLNALRRTRLLYRTVAEQVVELEAHKVRLDAEREVARSIFKSVVHRWPERLAGVRWILGAHSLFSGDILLIARAPGGALNVMVGDFTGHGLTAAVGSIPAAEVFYGMSGKGCSVQQIARELSGRLRQLLPPEMFCAAAILAIDPGRRSLAVWNGGLPPVLVRGEEGSIRRRCDSRNLPLGIVEEEPAVDRFELRAGDRLYLYTDGLTDLEVADGARLGQAALERLVCCADAFERIGATVDASRTGGSVRDDVTLVELSCPDIAAGSATLADAGPDGEAREWRFSVEFGPSSLRAIDPIPLLINAIGEVQGLSTHKSSVFTVMSELYNNVVEHGLLGLDSAMKSDPDGFAEYYEERARRLAALGRGHVTIDCRHLPEPGGGRLTVSVATDLPREKRKLADAGNPYSGRGLALVHALCESVASSADGTAVTAVFAWRYP